MLMQAAQLASSRTWRSRVCLLRQMALMHQMRLAGCLRICVCPGCSLMGLLRLGHPGLPGHPDSLGAARFSLPGLLQGDSPAIHSSGSVLRCAAVQRRP